MAEVRKSRADKAPIAPHFFELAAPEAPLGKALRWGYRKGTYWEDRRRGDWSECRDLFGLNEYMSGQKPGSLLDGLNE